MEAIIRLAAAVGVLFIMISWEYFSPRRTQRFPRLQRWSVNFGLALLNTLILRISVGAIAYQTAITAAENGQGLLNQSAVPQWLSILLTLILLDFAIYLQHIVFHKWPLLWRLHQIHHTDLDFDATTAVRFHPLEIIISMFYKVCFIYLLGADPAAVIAFEIILNGCATFNHSNVNIPEKIDKKLRLLIITPDMHRIHHSSDPPETDSNYGFSISCWDRLCKTYVAEPHRPQTQMEIGIKGFSKPEELGFLQLLFMPFQPLRKR